jgi:hypothetical protein
MRVPFPGLCCPAWRTRSGPALGGAGRSTVRPTPTVRLVWWAGEDLGYDGRSWRGVQAFGPVGAARLALRSPMLSMRDAGEVAVSPASANSAVPVRAGRVAIQLGKG